MDRLAREGTEYLAVEPAYPARTVVCFSSMLTGATPAEHGMRSNFAPRLGVRRESVFDVLEREGRRGRLVGIAHLLDPFGEDVVRSVTSVQPTSEIDRSLTAEARRVVDEEDPDLLVLQLLAADQLGHVRGVRSPEYLDQLAETDRHVGDFLAFLEERGKLEGATVILMADHGQGRGIGGHGHLDWGERPVPFVVWGEGAVPGAISDEPRSVLELAPTVSRLLGVPAPEAARGRPLVPARGLAVGSPPGARPRRCGGAAALPRDRRCARRGRPPLAGCSPASRRGLRAAGGRAARRRRLARRDTRDRARARRTRPLPRDLARARRRAPRRPRDRARRGLRRGGLHRRRRRVRPRGLRAPARAGRARPGRLRARLALPRQREGMSWHRTLTNRATSALVGLLLGTVTSDGQTGFRAFSARALAAARIAHDYNYAQVLTLSLWGAGIEAAEVPIRYRRRLTGRSFVRYPEYLARVAPAVWREWRAARASRRPAAAAPRRSRRRASTATRRRARTTATAR